MAMGDSQNPPTGRIGHLVVVKLAGGVVVVAVVVDAGRLFLCLCLRSVDGTKDNNCGVARAPADGGGQTCRRYKGEVPAHDLRPGN